MMKPIAAASLFLLMVTGALANDLPPESNRLHPDHLPTPFSAAQLAAHNVPGCVTVFRIEVDGREPILHVSTWLPSESGEGRYATQQQTLEGANIGEAQIAEAPWTELQSHASFPASATTITTEDVEVPAGSFTCWRYDVTRRIPVESGPPKTLVMSFWFAKDRPGPPALMKHSVDGALKLTMTLLNEERPEAPAGG